MLTTACPRWSTASSIQGRTWARAVATVAARTAGCRRLRLAEERIKEAICRGWTRDSVRSGDDARNKEDQDLLNRRRPRDFCVESPPCLGGEVGHAEGSTWEEVRVPLSAVP